MGGIYIEMTIQLELDPATEARLNTEAAARGLALEEYAGLLLRKSVPDYATGTGILTPEDLRQMLREIAQGSEKLPKLPTFAFDRASFYEDRT